MKINPIITNSLSSSSKKQSNSEKNYINLSFGSWIFTEARRVEKTLAKDGMKCQFNNHKFVALCIEKIQKIFKKHFGKNSLPKGVQFENLENCYGQYDMSSRIVTINSGLPCFNNLQDLKKEMKKSKNFLIPNEKSTIHPARTFVHEFGHCAHHMHLDLLHNGRGAEIMEKLRHTQVPTAIGRLITRFKLGNYALDKNGGMNEFMAERISKDVCNSLSEDTWEEISSMNVDYSNIFYDNWKYRYSSPQSYIDYFTQQVWNGNIEGAKQVGKDAYEYLHRLDAEVVPVTIKKLEKETVKIPILKEIVSGVSKLASWLTSKLDNKNDLLIKKERLKY